MRKFLYRIYAKVMHEALILKVRLLRVGYGVTHQKRKVPIIVSLTSYPNRFGNIDLCLRSLFLQKEKADRIILWLGSDSSEQEVKRLIGYKKYGLEIYIDNQLNLKSHKKYYYALRKYPDAINVTVDDDLVFTNDLISSLYATYRKYPDCIVARRVHKIVWKNETTPEQYLKWKGEFSEIVTPSKMLIPTTGAGTLYPPNVLSSEFSNVESFMKYALTADDIWMKVMSILAGTRVVWAKNKIQMPATVPGRNEQSSLVAENIDNQKNDFIFKKLLEIYKLNRSDFVD